MPRRVPPRVPGKLGVAPGSAPESAFPHSFPRKSTPGSTPWGTPNFPGTLGGTLRGTFWESPKALRKHSPEHFRRFPKKHSCKWPAGSQSNVPLITSTDFCNHCVLNNFRNLAQGVVLLLLIQLTICPETITELIRFEFLRCKNYVTAPEINSPRDPHSPEITVRKSFKPPVRITAPKNNSKTISVM